MAREVPPTFSFFFSLPGQIEFVVAGTGRGARKTAVRVGVLAESGRKSWKSWTTRICVDGRLGALPSHVAVQSLSNTSGAMKLFGVWLCFCLFQARRPPGWGGTYRSLRCVCALLPGFLGGAKRTPQTPPADRSATQRLPRCSAPTVVISPPRD